MPGMEWSHRYQLYRDAALLVKIGARPNQGPLGDSKEWKGVCVVLDTSSNE
jgi:hypothetical protein